LAPPTGRPAPAPPPLTLRTVALIAALFAVWRAAIFLASVGWSRLGISHPWEGDQEYSLLWRYSLHWDSGWYLSIVRDGYAYDPGGQSNIAFFPGLPMLTRLFDTALPGDEALAGMLVVHLALFGALLYLYQIVRIDYPEVVAWRSLFFLLIFPAAFFFSAYYTESLLLLGFVGTIYHARRGQWLLAGLFGAFTGFTKLIGLILLIPVALEMVRQGALRRDNPIAWIGAALAPAGALAYVAYLHAWLGDARVYFWNQRHWDRESFDPEPFLMLGRMAAGQDVNVTFYPGAAAGLFTYYFLFDMGLLLAFLTAGVVIWLRGEPTYGALVVAGSMVPALSGSPVAMARYMAILFPVFILLGRIESEAARNAIAIASMAGLAFTTYLFVNGFWAG
jgi:hypothetical protein